MSHKQPKSKKQDEIISVLQTFASVAKIRRESVYRVRAFNNAAQSIASLVGNFVSFYNSGQVHVLPGIGPRIYSIIDDVMEGKSLKDFSRISLGYLRNRRAALRWAEKSRKTKSNRHNYY